jgi:hypothetical protein
MIVNRLKSLKVRETILVLMVVQVASEADLWVKMYECGPSSLAISREGLSLAYRAPKSSSNWRLESWNS